MSHEEREKMLADYRESLLHLDRLVRLSFQSLDGFDEKRYPKVLP